MSRDRVRERERNIDYEPHDAHTDDVVRYETDQTPTGRSKWQHPGLSKYHASSRSAVHSAGTTRFVGNVCFFFKSFSGLGTNWRQAKPIREGVCFIVEG